MKETLKDAERGALRLVDYVVDAQRRRTKLVL